MYLERELEVAATRAFGSGARRFTTIRARGHRYVACARNKGVTPRDAYAEMSVFGTRRCGRGGLVGRLGADTIVQMMRKAGRGLSHQAGARRARSAWATAEAQAREAALCCQEVSVFGTRRCGRGGLVGRLGADTIVQMMRKASWGGRTIRTWSFASSRSETGPIRMGDRRSASARSGSFRDEEMRQRRTRRQTRRGYNRANDEKGILGRRRPWGSGARRFTTIRARGHRYVACARNKGVTPSDPRSPPVKWCSSASSCLNVTLRSTERA
jgi:hypothetical protein